MPSLCKRDLLGLARPEGLDNTARYVSLAIGTFKDLGHRLRLPLAEQFVSSTIIGERVLYPRGLLL